MTQAVRYRAVSLGRLEAQVERETSGVVRLRARDALAPYPRSLTQRLVAWAQACPQRSLFAKRTAAGEWQQVSYAQALEQARRLGQALLARGLSAQRPLVILSENDLEHALLALAAMHVGVPYAPVSPAYSLISQDHSRLRYLFDLLTPGLVFAADGARYAAAIRAAVPRDTELVVARAPLADRACTAYSELAATAAGAEVDAAHAAVEPDSIAKFLFTSGSTQQPKAVINTQRMLCSNQQMILQCLPFLGETPPVLVDWLPWHHTFGGNHNFGLVLYNGGTLYIDDGKPVAQLMQHTLRNLRDVAPTVYFNVPRGFEELVHALEADAGLRRNFFSRVQMLFYAAAGLSQPVWDALHRLAEQSVGERILMITSLGMTETAPFAICANWASLRAGEIGLPAPGMELKLAPSEDKLELRYRGPNVTPGFWRQDALWRASVDAEGYYRSGDAVRFVDASAPQRGLAFDGRIAEDFKLATGSWVSVGPLRARIIEAGAPYVQDVVVAGADRDMVGVLILPHLESCRRLSAHAAAQATQAEIARDPGVHAYFSALLRQLAAESTGSATRVARALLLPEALSIDLGEVTDKGSVNQRAVLRTRAALVAELYAPQPAAHVIVA